MELNILYNLVSSSYMYTFINIHTYIHTYIYIYIYINTLYYVYYIPKLSIIVMFELGLFISESNQCSSSQFDSFTVYRALSKVEREEFFFWSRESFSNPYGLLKSHITCLNNLINNVISYTQIVYRNHVISSGLISLVENYM